MSIIPLTPDNFEVFTLELNPRREFSSGSAGITGSVFLFAERSAREKQFNVGDPAFFNEDDSAITLDDIVKYAALDGVTDIQAAIEQYMQHVNSLAQQQRRLRTFSISRFSPTEKFDDIVTGSIRKLQVRNVLFPRHRCLHQSYHYAYSNYHSLNFFTASTVPSNSVMLYPSSASMVNANGLASGSYMPTGSFTFEFYINPRYTTDAKFDEYHAGTLFHLSSSYAVSLVTGSSVDSNGLPDSYKLQLQLSHSADIAPSRAVFGGYPNNLVFLSDEGALTRNSWHHVAIRWGTDSINDGTGSFIIDGAERGRFVVPSGSITPQAFVNKGNPDVLCVGNYYEGTNSGSDSQSRFFSRTVAGTDGTLELSPLTSVTQPDAFTFAHPLNAEVHELKIIDRHRTISEIFSASSVAPKGLDDLLFYLPPFFTKESPTRTNILTNPFQSRVGSTESPTNTDLSFRVSGRDINLENFTRELVRGTYPRLLSLTGSTQAGNTGENLSANTFLYRLPEVVKRNLTVLPCDNGRFRPNFSFLLSGTIDVDSTVSGNLLDRYVDDLGAMNLGLINLSDMLHSSSMGIPTTNTGSLLGSTPTVLAEGSPGVYSLFQLTGESHSPDVVFFSVSNIYYGNNIEPGSLVITDPEVTGSDKKISFTLRDDGCGNLYRGDSEGSHAKWSSVGNVLYDEGIIFIKSPELPFFGKDEVEISFKGSQTVHVMRINTPAPSGMLNSSSNPTYIPVSASLDPNDQNQKFVFITGCMFHDENLNVVMRTNFAQPVQKREVDSLLFKQRIDF